MATSTDQSNVISDNQQKLETLKRLRENVNWKIEGERRGLLNQLYPLVTDWTNQLLNLRDIFGAEEIDWLLMESIKSANLENFRVDIVPFVNFLRRTGYKDEPKLDEDGTPLWRRTTPVSSYYTRLVIFDIFKIYEKYSCQYYDFTSVRRILELGQDPNCLIRKTGRSTLHVAMTSGQLLLSSLLLKEGANPLLADQDGLTPLHTACKVLYTELIVKRLLKYPMVQVGALDKLGRTPLHYTLMIKYNVVHKNIQVLLENGANPNSADLDGFTPLHLICQRQYAVDLIEPFFKMCDEKHHLVPVDPLDNRGRTPLYYAVANLFPNNVDFLLNRGADLSNLVFPTESDFDEGIKVWLERHYDYKLRIASGAMGVVENLERRGYELDQNNVLMIMKWYAKYGLFEKSEELEKYLYKDEEFVSKAKNQMIRSGVPTYHRCCYADDDDDDDDDDVDDDDDETEDEDRAEKVVKKAEESLEGPSLSLYDLIQLRAEEIEKLLTFWDYEHVAHTCSRWGLTDRARLACVVHLCEMRSRRFFRRWAVYPFWDLIRQRLPLEICEMIVEHLTNEDLYNICLAV